jgi:argininosuccinate lyase
MEKSTKIWSGRSKGRLDPQAEAFNSSINIDKRLWKEDIIGSIAHVKMLKKTEILSVSECDKIIDGLQGICNDIESGSLIIDESHEDIHSYIESILTSRIGDLGKKLHTARSRNDQVATDLRLYVKGAITELKTAIVGLEKVIVQRAKQHTDTIMPGYTHLQRAQPVLFAHHLLAYFEMFARDYDRLNDALGRVCVSPLGAAALAGTTYPIDRDYVAAQLGFESCAKNSIDAVSDRDFVIETISACAQIMSHLSRFAEEIILWSSLEFGYIEIDDAFSTGSSIMPQKKNPDIAELVRGKTSRVYGNLFAILTLVKGLPLAYNKDMQEDKGILFDCVDTVNASVSVFALMIESMRVNKDAMLKAASTGFINATDCADYLVSDKKLPFRTAYSIAGNIVRYCIDNGYVLENLPLQTYKTFSPLFDEDIYKAVDMQNCLNRRISKGGTAKREVLAQIERAEKYFN